jgi:hypothetical protein
MSHTPVGAKKRTRPSWISEVNIPTFAADQRMTKIKSLIPTLLKLCVMELHNHRMSNLRLPNISLIYSLRTVTRSTTVVLPTHCLLSILSLLPLFWGNQSRLMWLSRCLRVCLCVCLRNPPPPANFWMAEPISMKLGTYIMAPEPISTAYFIKPAYQSVCLHVYPSCRW